MKQLCVNFLLGILVNVAMGQISGQLSGTLGPGELHVVDDISVIDGASLTLEPGTVFLFDGAYTFEIYGTLTAVGTETDSIYFTTDTTANPDRWRSLFFEDENSSGSTLSYCVVEFSQAQVGHGGGIYLNDSSPTLTHCTIRYCEANYGAGLNVEGSSSIFISCAIVNNYSGNDGGGMYVRESELIMSDCLIADNSSFDDGGGIYSYNDSTNLSNCTVSGNVAGGDGGGIAITNSSSLSLTDCFIRDNTANIYSGGIYCLTSTPAIVNCDVRNNIANAQDGGGIGVWYGSPTLTLCRLDSNQAGRDGGGIHLYDTESVLDECTISDNTSGRYGGGVNSDRDTLSTITNCTISGNTTDLRGGGVNCFQALTNFDHCLLFDNHSEDDAGGIFTETGSPVFTSCTIYGNSAVDLDCGVLVQFSAPIFNSSIISDEDGYGIWLWNAMECELNYCDVFSFGGESVGFADNSPMNGPANLSVLEETNANGDSCDVYHNIFLDPVFVDAANEDYHLLVGSPCINAGDPELPIDPDGSVAEIGTFYFENNPPSPFSLLSPTDGSTIDAIGVVLAWEAASDPDPGDEISNYRVYLAFDPDFNVIGDIINQSDTEVALEDLLDDNTFWWRVEAFDTQGNSTLSTQSWHFTTYHEDSPLPFSLIAPTDDATTATSGVDFSWHPSSDPDPGDSVVFYRIYLALDEGFNNIADSSEVAGTEITINGMIDDTTYWWRVGAFDTQGNTTLSNESRHFTTYQMEAPLPFSLLEPENGAFAEGPEILMTWEESSDPDPGDSIAFYRVYLSTDSTFTSEADSQDVTESEATVGGLIVGQVYWWRVKAFDTQGYETFSNEIWHFMFLIHPVSDTDAVLPTEFALHQNYPNPFNPSTTIAFDLPQTSEITLTVYDLLGRETAELANTTLDAGRHRIVWNCTDYAAGVYLIEMKADGFREIRKAMLLR